MIIHGWKNQLTRFPHVSESGVKFTSQKWKEKWEKVFTDNLKGKHLSDAWAKRHKNSRRREQMDGQ